MIVWWVGETSPILNMEKQMKELSIDIETFSSLDLAKCGVYRYVEAADFDILLFSYSVDGGKVQFVDLKNGEQIPEEIIAALLDDRVIKWAFNAMFERICLSEWLIRKGVDISLPVPFGHETIASRYLDPSSWRCSMVWSAYMGLPLSLEGVGSILGLEKQKLKEGRDLVRFFCVPCKATKANGQRERNLPEHDLQKWQQLIDYNIRDVETELAIKERLAKFPMPDFEWENYRQDQEINDRGILLDQELVHEAIRIDNMARHEIAEQMKDLTKLDNPNSVSQMKEWLLEQNIETESLDKAAVKDLMKSSSGEIREVLLLRQQLAKSSVRKYTAMEQCVCKDGRARGLIQFYGANRTGRYSGRLIQVQNLPRNDMQDLELARVLVKKGDYETLDLLFDSIPHVLSELIRTAFIPKEGRQFVVADFSAIEARVLAWLADERWRMDLFENGGDIYCQSASKMFGVPVEKHGVNAQLRQKGKISELACGYGGSVGALKAMGALEMGLLEEELGPLVQSWRSANPKIVQFWWDVNGAALAAVKERRVSIVRGIHFEYKSGMLRITLPSGRTLHYVKPRIGENRFGGESITFEGVGTAKRWERLETYGAKIVENIVQGISRDLLCHAMQTLRYCDIVMHVHDEIVIEAEPRISLKAICQQMSRTPDWAPGLILDADGFICDFYKKD
jgi:DNA polymerase